MASSPNPFCTLGLSVWNRSKKTSFLAPQFWEPDPDAVPQLFCREIILAEQVEVPPGNRRAVGHRFEKRLAALGIRDLFQLLRQIEIVPADNAVLDEPLAGFGHLLVFFFLFLPGGIPAGCPLRRPA